MAGTQVVPRLACLAFQEWTPRVHSFFSSNSVIRAELRRKKIFRVDDVSSERTIRASGYDLSSLIIPAKSADRYDTAHHCHWGYV